MDAIQVTACLTVHEGKLEEFKALTAQCVRSVRERDSGTLQYDGFFNDTHTECVVRETYKDSGAVLEHIANLGAILGAILGVCDMALLGISLRRSCQGCRWPSAQDRTLRQAQNDSTPNPGLKLIVLFELRLKLSHPSPLDPPVGGRAA